jgi:hypothetical protein
MILHTQEECEQWIEYRTHSPLLTKSLFFIPNVGKGNMLFWNVADIGSKCFQHNQHRILQNIEQIEKNYPKISPILENMHIFMCPRPSADTANACANEHQVTYFARSTQIPWCMTDYITAHELGHSIQGALCKNWRSERGKFVEYLTLRNAPIIECEFDEEDEDGNDITVYRDDFAYISGTYEQKQQYHGTWDFSPLEWFAEDFRYLFGTDKGDKYWGLPIPKPNNKIKEFMLSL